MIANAGGPKSAASLPNHSGPAMPTNSSVRLRRPPSLSKIQRQRIDTPTPASTLGRYHAARKKAIPRTFCIITIAARSARSCPPGTAIAA